MKALPLPTFDQAGTFAARIGIKTPAEWAEYIKDMSRDELFQRVSMVLIGHAPEEGPCSLKV